MKKFLRIVGLVLALSLAIVLLSGCEDGTTGTR